MKNLKLCPFCGQPPVRNFVPPEVAGEGPGYYTTKCPGEPLDCPGSTPMSFGDTQAEADAAWDTRHPATPAASHA